MSVDLAIYPFSYPDTENEWWLGYDRLCFRRDYYLFSCLGLNAGKHDKVVNPKEIPDNISFDVYMDDGIERNVKEDPYGNKLTYIYAEEINNIPNEVIKNTPNWNKAILKMLMELNEKDIIILYWY